MRTTHSLIVTACLAGASLMTTLAGPHAVEIVRAQGPFGPAPYDDPLALTGPPATRFYDPLGAFSGGTTNRRVKLVEPAHNIALDTNGLPTPNLLLTYGSGSEVIVRFDQAVSNNPVNPYGVDLLVFGNAFYTPNAFVNNTTDMSGLALTGSVLQEPLKVSVSPGYTGQAGEVPGDPDTWPWYRYDAGPYGDAVFPTHAFKWDRNTTNWTDDLMDFTKPVNPGMQPVIAAGGLTAADAIDLYAGSGGGTGFDIAESGFGWIQYVKVDGLDAGYGNGEIDSFSVIRPRITGETLSITPWNTTNNTAALFFQWPTAPSVTQLQLDFLSLSDAALVNTAPFTNFSALPPLPGTPLTAVEIELTPILTGSNVTFQADLTLSAGIAYNGDGSDLSLFQSAGSSWISPAFTYDPVTTQLHANGLTNLSAFVVAQLTAPTLGIELTMGTTSLTFTPVAGNLHTLQRSTDLITWTAIHAFTATNSAPVSIPDNSPPPSQAFYRLRMTPP